MKTKKGKLYTKLSIFLFISILVLTLTACFSDDTTTTTTTTGGEQPQLAEARLQPLPLPPILKAFLLTDQVPRLLQQR